jgi:hypothetical protein
MQVTGPPGLQRLGSRFLLTPMKTNQLCSHTLGRGFTRWDMFRRAETSNAFCRASASARSGRTCCTISIWHGTARHPAARFIVQLESTPSVMRPGAFTTKTTKKTP